MKQHLNEFCGDFQKIDDKIKKVMLEKQQVEKLVVEIVSFGETCDHRFDSLQNDIQAYSERDKIEFNQMKKSYNLVKIQLTETLKNLLVEIDDHTLRDEVLNTLNLLSSEDLEKSVSYLIEKLIQRVRDLVKTNR
jgi:hypothetical protein